MKGCQRLPDRRGDVCFGLGELGTEPRKRSDEIVENENLSVTRCARTDSDGGDWKRAGDGCCGLSGDEFENYRGNAGFRELRCVVKEACGIVWCFAFYAVAALFANTLRQHADMADDGDSGAAY